MGDTVSLFLRLNFVTSKYLCLLYTDSFKFPKSTQPWKSKPRPSIQVAHGHVQPKKTPAAARPSPSVPQLGPLNTGSLLPRQALGRGSAGLGWACLPAFTPLSPQPIAFGTVT